MHQAEMALHLARREVLAAEERVARQAAVIGEIRDRGHTTVDAMMALESHIVLMRRARGALERAEEVYGLAGGNARARLMDGRNGTPPHDADHRYAPTARVIGLCLTGLLAMLALSLGLACLLREKAGVE